MNIEQQELIKLPATKQETLYFLLGRRETPCNRKLCHFCFCDSSIRACNPPGIDQPQMLSRITSIVLGLLLLATCGGVAQSE